MRTGLLFVLVGLLPACMLLPQGADERSRSVYLLAPEARAPSSSRSCGSIQVSPGNGASGFRSARMAYMREPYQLEYFAWSVWADSPARMLGQAVREYFHESGAFTAVVSTPAATGTDLRLDLADGKLLQRFSDSETSEIELTLEARVFAPERPQEISSKRFVITEPAGGNPREGVRAANAAAARLLESVFELVAENCSESAGQAN